MTDLAKKKDEAKKEIRSLLLSAPLGLTLSELKRDFLEFIGHPLPWKNLGYSSPEDFIQDLSDTVKVTWGNAGMVLTGVANKSTQHIEKMVSKQKIDTKVKKKVTERRIRQAMHTAPPLMRGGGHGGSWGGQGRNFQRFNEYGRDSYHQRQPPRMQQHQRARHLMAPPSVPAYIRGQIAELLSQHPEGLPLTHICAIFRNRYGVPLDYRAMGFSTEQDLLSSLRDIVGMRTLGGGETRVLSLPHCVSWDQNRWNGTSNRSNNSSGGYQRNPIITSQNKQSQPHISSSAPLNKQPILPKKQSLLNDLPSHSQANNNPPTVGKGRGRGGGVRRDTSSQAPGGLSSSAAFSNRDIPSRQLSSNTDSGRDSIELEHSSNIPTKVQDEIRQIMMKRPKGVCASRLPFEYKNMFGKALSTSSYGYNSVIEFVSDLPHIIKIERPHPQGDWHLLSVIPSAEQRPDHPVKASRSNTGTHSPPPLEVDKALKESVAQVLCISPDGIPLDKFLDTYKAVTGKTLDIAKYGSGGLKRILHSMSDVLIISLDASDNAIVLPKMQSGPRRFDQLQDQFKPISTSGSYAEDSVLHLPPDAVGPGCRYHPQPVPTPSVGAEEGNYIELYVSNVMSPATFWIQLRGRDTTLALEDLMDELEAVYSNSKKLPKEYNMTPQLAQRGMVCAVIFPEDSFWHRGLITGFKDQLYQVYFVDYGNTCCVSVDQMKLLKSKFMKLPAQAIQARLGNIKPISGEWMANSKARLLTLAREKPLLGLVVGEKDRVLSLCLVDTSKEEDIHFNDVFVDEGYAVFEPDEEIVQDVVHDQVPSSTFIYGPDNNPSTSGQAGQTTPDVQAEPFRKYIRQAQMMEGVTMNLINYNRQLHLTLVEISALFSQPQFISAKLREDRANIMKVVYKRDYPDLFTELLLYEAPGVDKDSDSICLFALVCLPVIIDLYGRDDQLDELKSAAVELVQWFNPDDPFWKGEEDAISSGDLDPTMAEEDDDVRTQSSEDNMMPSLEDLQLVLKSMEIKRDRILKRMMQGSLPPECVEELTSVELHISRVKEFIARREGKPSDNLQAQSKASADNLNSTQAQPRASLNATTAMTQSKTPTGKVAPMIQTPAPVTSSQPVKTDANPPPVIPAADQMALLQQHILMNQMFLQQCGISTPNPLFPSQLPSAMSSSGDGVTSQLLRNLGRGTPTPQMNQFMQGGLMQAPGISNSQLLNQQSQLNSLTAGLAGLGIMNPQQQQSVPTSATTQQQKSGITPPGMTFDLSAMGRGQLMMPASHQGGMNFMPQNNSALGAGLSAGSRPSGLQQQQQTNRPMSALHRNRQQ